jgi:hypothetical protein
MAVSILLVRQRPFKEIEIWELGRWSMAGED